MGDRQIPSPSLAIGVAHYDRSALEVLSNFSKPPQNCPLTKLDLSLSALMMVNNIACGLRYDGDDDDDDDDDNYDDDDNNKRTQRALSDLMFCPHEFNILSPAQHSTAQHSRAISKHLKISTDRDIFTDNITPRGTFGWCMMMMMISKHLKKSAKLDIFTDNIRPCPLVRLVGPSFDGNGD